MNVVIIVKTNKELSGDAAPIVLMPLIDRPFLQHIIERLVDLGADKITFAIGPHSEGVKKLFPKGTRWGVKFHYVQATDDRLLYKAAAASLDAKIDSPVLFGHADRLPGITSEMISEPLGPGQCRQFTDEATGEWTAWAQVSPDLLRSVPDVATEQEIGALIAEKSVSNYTLKTLDVRSYQGLLAAQAAGLSGEFPGLIITGRTVHPGVRLSRNSNVHPTAVLTGNIFIGENSRIGADVQLGPNVVIGSDCVIEAETTVTNSLVLSGTYLGEGLELNNVIADRGYILSVVHNAAIVVPDTFIAGSLHTPLFARILQRTRGRS